jgi:cytochrome c-type biogenesis protein CcmF
MDGEPVSAEIGNFLLEIAIICSFVQLIFAIPKGRTGYIPALAIVSALAIFSAFMLLIWSFATSNFAIELVYLHSHTEKPPLYKIAATWGNHEGSMLLWCVILGIYSLLLTIKTSHKPNRLELSAVMAGLLVIFLSYLRFASSPFVEMFPPALQGQGFNPLLQDFGLALHPPILYIGYVGVVAPFVYAMAFLLKPNLISPSEFGRAIHSYVIFAWAMLSAGIALGSWWAYRELGWGGWWFWDPVENVALLPWLTLTALFHCNIVLQRDGNMLRLVIILALICFTLSLIGTFLVRSGVLNSVHSFAADPKRGILILSMIALISGIGLVLYLRSLTQLPSAKAVHLFSKQAAILINNWLLLMSMLMILLATFYPFIMEWVSGKIITIGTSYYNPIFTSLMLPLVAVCALSHFLIYDNHSGKKLKTKSIIALCEAGIITAIWLYFLNDITWLLALGLFAGVWLLIAATKTYLFNQAKLPKLSMFLGHFALGLFVLSATIFGAYNQQGEFLIKKGDTKTFDAKIFGEYQITLQNVEFGRRDNYLFQRGKVKIRLDNKEYIFYPEERFYEAEQQFTAESDIKHLLMYDIYITMKRSGLNQNINQNNLGGNKSMQPYMLKIYINPAMAFLWLACILFVMAGLWSICYKIKIEKL